MCGLWNKISTGLSLCHRGEGGVRAAQLITAKQPLVVNLLKGGRYSGEDFKLFGVRLPHLLHHRVGVQQYALPSFYTLIEPKFLHCIRT